MERIRELHDYTTESPPAPSEVLGLIVLRNAERIQAANLATVRSNLDVLREFFQRHDELFIWPQPQAGTVCLPCFRKGKLDR
jgi:aspartate/methionine/tyrosine aminotransferase|eukprot:COSAG06_NODE_2231_length_7287_cov_56.373539_3_plen_82_part_00